MSTKKRAVVQRDRSGDVVGVYESVSEASRITGVCRSAISMSINKTPSRVNGVEYPKDTVGGYSWEAADD